MEADVEKIFERRLKEIQAEEKWTKENIIDYDEKFLKKHGKLKLYFVKFQLGRYLKKQEKHSKLLQKYELCHKSLSLAIAAGFASVKKHHEYLKELSQKIEEKNGNN